MLKFRCDACGQKMGVPEKFAGKRVRCTGCKEPVRVPDPEPELQPVEELDGYDVEPAEDNDPFADALGGLSELDGQSGELQQLQPAPEAAPAAAGGTCPKCAAPVGAEAVICVQCGHNLKLGVNVKTVAKAKATAGFASKTLLALIGGAVVACLAGGLWGGIVIATHYEIGWVAWGIGALVGIAVAAMAQKQDFLIGVAAAGLALLGLVVGKAIILQWMLSPGFILSVADLDFDDPELFTSIYYNQMFEDKLFEPGLQMRLEEYATHDDYDQALEQEAQAAATEAAAGLTEAEREAVLDKFEASFRAAEFGDESFISMLKYTFTFWDALWFFLAVSTAFKIGCGLGGGD